MLIRDEALADSDAIHELTLTAFKPMPFSDGAEADIIRGLRRSGDLTVSLVAEEDRVVVGHVAFSPVTIEGMEGDWFGLGPVAVRQDRQRRGIGRKLIERGLDLLRQRGAAGCVLIGDPALYGRFGFRSGELDYAGLDRRYVQGLAFDERQPAGQIKFAPAFGEH